MKMIYKEPTIEAIRFAQGLHLLVNFSAETEIGDIDWDEEDGYWLDDLK